MVLVKNGCRMIFIIALLFLMTACSALPVDWLPRPPTLIPGIGATASPTLNVDQATSTAPGFPTQPVLETQEPPVNEVTITPAVVQTATLPSEVVTPSLPTPTPRPEPFFALQAGNPQPLMNFLKPDLGCNWMGIGGQVFDLQNGPLSNFLVRIEGELDSTPVSVLGLTGGTPQLGPGGFLLEIASRPIESSGMLYLQILDLEGRVLSDKVFITTYSDCERNFILVNFTQLPAGLDTKIFLPAISKD